MTSFIKCLGSMLLLIVQTPCEAWTLRHMIEPTDSFISLQTQGLCYSIMASKDAPRCLPWANQVIESGSISVLALAKANEEGLKIYQRARDRDINPQFLDRIFRVDNFQDTSGFMEARALYRNFFLSISPIHFVAGFRLNNPSLPEVHFVEQRQAMIQTGATWLLDWSELAHYGQFLIAPLAYHYDRQSSFGDYDLLESATTPYRELVSFTHSSGYNFDLAVGWSSKVAYIPSLTLQSFRILPDEECQGCKKPQLDIDSINQSRSQISLSWAVDHAVGQSIFGFVLKFDGIWIDFVAEQAAFSYIYKLSKLESFLAVSELQRSFGFLLDAGPYQLGIQYSNEQQDVALHAKRINHSYVFTSLVL